LGWFFLNGGPEKEKLHYKPWGKLGVCTTARVQGKGLEGVEELSPMFNTGERVSD